MLTLNVTNPFAPAELNLVMWMPPTWADGPDKAACMSPRPEKTCVSNTEGWHGPTPSGLVDVKPLWRSQPGWMMLLLWGWGIFRHLSWSLKTSPDLHCWCILTQSGMDETCMQVEERGVLHTILFLMNSSYSTCFNCTFTFPKHTILFHFISLLSYITLLSSILLFFLISILYTVYTYW